MIDLTNNTSVNVDELIDKYKHVLTLCKYANDETIPSLAYILYHIENYVKNKYDSYDTDAKVWMVISVLDEINDCGDDILEKLESIVDTFVTYYDDNYFKYCENIGISSSKFDQDITFYKYYKLGVTKFK